MNAPPPSPAAFDERRHQRTMRALFLAFAASVFVLWLAALVVDAGSPGRERMEVAKDRALVGIVFFLGILHVLISAVVRIFAAARAARAADRNGLARIALSVAIIAFALCETPALFGLVYVLLGGETFPATFFFTFSLTAIAAHHVARIRP